MNDDKQVRIDKWLWAARFYKTRTLAANAVTNGRVKLNGARIKPSKQLRLNDKLRSEEHTSELQSRSELVCRLLLEKKKKQHTHTHNIDKYTTK